MDEVERALSQPDVERAVPVLDALNAAFDQHVEATERPGGFLDMVVGDSPRLAHACDALRDEHVSLAKQIGELCDTARAEGRPEVVGQAADVLAALNQHRHRGAELVYEAYSVDIAAAD
jgi:hypothetical protein